MRKLEHILAEAAERSLESDLYRDSVRLYHDVVWIEDAPDDAFDRKMYQNLGLGHTALREYDIAAHAYRAALERSGDSPTDTAEILLDRGRMLNHLGWYLPAAHDLESAIEQLSQSPANEFREVLIGLVEKHLRVAQAGMESRTWPPQHNNGRPIPGKSSRAWISGEA